MKTIDKVSNTVAIRPETTISMKTIEFAPKKFWLPLVFGVSLVYMGAPLYAAGYQDSGKSATKSESGNPGQGGKWGLRQGTESQGAGRGTKPNTGYKNKDTGSGGDTMDSGTMNRGTSPGVNMGNRPGGDPTNRGASPDINRGTTPGTDEMNRGATPMPGSDPTMERGTTPTPGSDNINRDTTSPGGDNMMRDAIPGGEGMDRE